MIPRDRFITIACACLIWTAGLQASDLLSLLEDKKEKEQSTWRQESLAQDHEEAFIRLWDELRNTTDPVKVLRNFPFRLLRMGRLAEAVDLDHGIQSRIMGSATGSITWSQWGQWLEQMESLGYHLVQSEWHHKEFRELKGAPNESIFSFTLHVENESVNLRVAADGRLKVYWKPGKDSTGIYVPDTIEITELEILQRIGDPFFKRLGSFEIAAKKRGPVLAYDLDSDGFAEILMPSTSQIAWNDQGNGYRLEALNEMPIVTCRSAVLGDFDRNGTVDLVIDGSIHEKKFAPPTVGLFIFRGDEAGSFSAAPEKIVVDPVFRVQADTTLTAGDIDKDGDLDLWLGQYKEPYLGGSMPTPFFDSNDGHPSYLLLNEGDGSHFIEKTKALGISEKQNRRVYSSSFVDYDNDLDLDLFVVSDFSGVDLYENDGYGKFIDVTDSAIDVRFLFGMAHSIADFNYDGQLDMYAIGMSSTTANRLHKMGAGRDDFASLDNMRLPMAFGNRLYINQGSGVFKQPNYVEEVARTGWSWGVVTADFDNDGDLDFYVANGHDSNTTARDYCTSYWTDDIYRGTSDGSPLMNEYFGLKLEEKEQKGISWNGFEHNFFYMPMSNGEFRNVSFLAGVALERDSRMVVADDVNMDGKLDLIIDSNAPNWNPDTDGNMLEVYLNQMPSSDNFVGVRLQDAPGAPLSTGARITVSAGGRIQAAAHINGDSFESQHSGIKHFGIGAVDKVDFIEVVWLDGSKKRIENPTLNQYHLIEYGREG